ncbi:uncharacterized protein LOC144938283 isoform X1 [Lampetra fluviatilis]
MSGTPPLRPGVVAQLQGTGRRSLQERLLRALTGRPSFPPDSVAGLLRQQGADVNVGLGTQLPLHCACMVGNTEGLRLLLQSGAMVTPRDPHSLYHNTLSHTLYTTHHYHYTTHYLHHTLHHTLSTPHNHSLPHTITTHCHTLSTPHHHSLHYHYTLPLPHTTHYLTLPHTVTTHCLYLTLHTVTHYIHHTLPHTLTTHCLTLSLHTHYTLSHTIYTTSSLTLTTHYPTLSLTLYPTPSLHTASHCHSLSLHTVSHCYSHSLHTASHCHSLSLRTASHRHSLSLHTASHCHSLSLHTASHCHSLSLHTASHRHSLSLHTASHYHSLSLHTVTHSHYTQRCQARNVLHHRPTHHRVRCKCRRRSIPAPQVDAVDGYKRRALHYAAERSFSDCVALLLAAGAGASPPDGNGDTPLHWAAFRGRAGSARALLRGGACCRAADAHGETPLHWAAKRGQRAIAAALLRRGADPRARNRLGETPVAQLLALMAHRYRNDDDDGDDGDDGDDDDDDDDDSGEDEGDERNDQEGCLRLLLAAAGGWVDLPREDQGSQILGRISSCPRLWVRVQSLRSRAPSLANQSRAAVRCALGVRDLRPVVEMLPLPRALQQFLLLRQ